MAEFLAMGGYAGFVWSVYGLALLVFAGLLWFVRADLARQRRELRALEQAGATGDDGTPT